MSQHKGKRIMIHTSKSKTGSASCNSLEHIFCLTLPPTICQSTTKELW